MRAKKLKAFTLVELMVTLLISTLLIGFTYFLFRTVHLYFKKLDQNGEQVADRALARLKFREGMEEADSIYHRNEAIVFFEEADSLRWAYRGDSLWFETPYSRQAFYTGAGTLRGFTHHSLPWIDRVALRFGNEEEAFFFSKEYPLAYKVN